jgi:dolichyl-phosphate beta-glucosyltransferase
MLNKPEFSLILPAYNEAKRIEPTLKDMLGFLEMLPKEKYEMLIVMDGCNDGTHHIVKEVINNHPWVNTLIFPNRLGKGGAILEALKYAQGEIVAFIDADGSIPSCELNNLVKWTKQYDLVIGSRYKRESQLLIERPLIRGFLSRAFNVLVRLLFWRLNGINDTQCGVKVFKKNLTEQIRKDFLVSDFTFDVNLIYSALLNGYSVKEVGITWIDKDGSKLSHGFFRQIFIMLLSLLRLRIYHGKSRKILKTRFVEKLSGLIYTRLQF